MTIRSHNSGMPGIQAHFSRPFLITTTVTTVSAIAASSWLAMPNSGNSVLIPPSGSVTPISRMLPHAATTITLQIQAPTRQLGLRSRRSGPPRLASPSESMKRATRVPASTVVRMNSASNMIAKWYQNALSALPPNTWLSTSDMPNARVGAPPVRETMLSSPTLCAAAVISAPVIGGPDRPSLFTYAAAVSAVAPVAAAGALIAKYRC